MHALQKTQAEIVDSNANEVNHIVAFFDEPKAKSKLPRLVCVDGRIVADAVVIVSPADPNWWRGMAVRHDGEVKVQQR